MSVQFQCKLHFVMVLDVVKVARVKLLLTSKATPDPTLHCVADTNNVTAPILYSDS